MDEPNLHLQLYSVIAGPSPRADHRVNRSLRSRTPGFATCFAAYGAWSVLDALLSPTGIRYAFHLQTAAQAAPEVTVAPIETCRYIVSGYLGSRANGQVVAAFINNGQGSSTPTYICDKLVPLADLRRPTSSRSG